jgi:hypothetical protein
VQHGLLLLCIGQWDGRPRCEWHCWAICSTPVDWTNVNQVDGEGLFDDAAHFLFGNVIDKGCPCAVAVNFLFGLLLPFQPDEV